MSSAERCHNHAASSSSKQFFAGVFSRLIDVILPVRLPLRDISRQVHARRRALLGRLQKLSRTNSNNRFCHHVTSSSGGCRNRPNSVSTAPGCKRRRRHVRRTPPRQFKREQHVRQFRLPVLPPRRVLFLPEQIVPRQSSRRDFMRLADTVATRPSSLARNAGNNPAVSA